MEMLLSYCLLLLPVPHIPVPMNPPALSLSRTSLVSLCWICPKWRRWPWATNGFPLQESFVIDWHNYKWYFGWTHKNTLGGMFSFLMVSQISQIFILMLHQCTGRMAASLVSEMGVRVNSCSLQHPDLLPCVRSCLTFLNLLISSAFLSTSELQGLFYFFRLSHHAVV